MSSIVNKVKEALHSDKSSSTTHNTSSGAPEGTYGPHSGRVANVADPRVDSDRDGSHNTGRTAGHGEYGSATGGYAHGTAHGDGPAHTGLESTGTTGYGSGAREGEHGPHSSRTANALDPRVDSDRDGSRNAGAAGGYGSTGHTAGMTGTSGLGHSSGTREGEHGPHGSRVANTMDPRVDSDRDGSRNVGAAGGYGTGHTTDTSGLGSSGFGSSGHTGTSGYTGTTGHHAGSGTTGMTGTHGAPTGTHGPHDSRLANTTDPRVDSDRDGRGALGHNAPGPAPNTAGPHKSDMMNKLDPRVDSDLDGSKTAGGNKTYQHGGSLTGNKDPTDASQVPPSVLRQHVGEPTLEHNDHNHGRERRNSSATHQETYRGM